MAFARASDCFDLDFCATLFTSARGRAKPHRQPKNPFTLNLLRPRNGARICARGIARTTAAFGVRVRSGQIRGDRVRGNGGV